MKKKAFVSIGMIVSILIILMGLLVMTGSMGGSANYASSVLYPYDSGYASFGGDFYSFVNNNAADAANAVHTVASNLVELSKLAKNFCGIILMGFGVFGFCHFGMLRCDLVSEERSENSALPWTETNMTTEVVEPESTTEEATEQSATE